MKTSFHSGKWANDYYSFGSPMPGRAFNSGDYRYGFNKMEKDDELKGTGNSYDFGARIYDPRIGRWLSLDPSMKKYPGFSPYGFSFNNPIIFNDPDGKDARLKVDNENHSITLETTVYLYGPDSKGLAAQMKSPGERKFVVDGVEWTVNIKITYKEISEEKMKAINDAHDMSNREAAEGPLRANELTPSEKQSLDGFQEGDNLMEIDNSKAKGSATQGYTTLFASGGTSTSSGKTARHEPLHMMGFSDMSAGFSDAAYKEVDWGGIKMQAPIGAQGPEDVMVSGTGGTDQVSALHYVDLIKYAIENKVPTGTTVLKSGQNFGVIGKDYMNSVSKKDFDSAKKSEVVPNKNTGSKSSGTANPKKTN